MLLDRVEAHEQIIRSCVAAPYVAASSDQWRQVRAEVQKLQEIQEKLESEVSKCMDLQGSKGHNADSSRGLVKGIGLLCSTRSEFEQQQQFLCEEKETEW